MGLWKGRDIALLLIGGSASILLAIVGGCVSESPRSPGQGTTAPSDRPLMAPIEGRSEDSPADFAKQLYGGAPNAELRRELWEAVFQYDRALELTPLFDAFEARAAALYALGWRGEAIADYTRALDLRQDSLVYLERGQVFLEMNQYGAAEADFLRALELDLPDSDLRDAYVGLGDAHRNLGALEAAISDYSIAIRMDPDNWSPYYWRGVSLVGLQRFPAALDDFSRVIAQRPLGTSTAYYARGVLNWMNGQCELARDDLTVFGNLDFDKDLLARAPFYLEYLRGATRCDPPPEDVSILIEDL